MKKIILLAVIILTTLSSQAQIAPVYTITLDKLFDSLCKKHNFKGASASIVVPNEGIWERTYGVSHGTTPITKNMCMGIGSNTKTFTAVMMLKLQEKGLLDLDDTIGKWVQHPNIDGKIPIRELLNHTSGIYSYTDNNDINNLITPPYTQIYPIDRFLTLVKPSSVFGGSFNYSNTNYAIAGIIISDVTGKALHTAFRDELLDPYGFDDTYFFPYEMPPANSIPHAWSSVLNSGPAMQDMDVVHNYSHNAYLSLAGAAGCMMSTAKDNAKFWNLLVEGKLLNSASMTEMQTLVQVTLSQGYGLGIFSRSMNNRDIITHGGTLFGFINENLADKTSGVSISLLTNQDSVVNSIILNGIIRELHKVTIQYTDVATIDKKKNITVYPNPANDVLNIKLDYNGAAVLQLYDVAGKQMQIQSISKGDNRISLSDLTNGTYFLNITDKGVPVHKQTITILK
ncbi:MAG: serine hydrolase [Flavipsychrobacter sp.]